MAEADLDLTLAGGFYDRTMALISGRVRPAGVRLRYLAMPIEEVFWRALRHAEFDAAEISLAYYMTLRARGDRTYTAIPVFPSRFFRHGCIFVPAGSPRRALADLCGATIGLPEYTMTACVWVRGLLADECGIRASEIRWRAGGIEHPGRRDRADLDPPPGVDLRPIDPGTTLNQLLSEGRLDAVISPRIPSAYWSGGVRRLPPDFQAAEADYFERTGIFPVMHTVALRTDVYERHPWVAQSLFDAYQAAKQAAYEWLADINALPVALPWYVAEYERTRRIFGRDPWADGFDANRRQLLTLARYLAEQGLAPAVDVEMLFAPNTRDRFVI
jgi:4,5-dihydroxyphthalate decarboxylase